MTQPVNDYNDGSGYWYSVAQYADSWTYTIHADDNTAIDSTFGFPTKEEATAAAIRAITTWREA